MLAALARPLAAPARPEAASQARRRRRRSRRAPPERGRRRSAVSSETQRQGARAIPGERDAGHGRALAARAEPSAQRHGPSRPPRTRPRRHLPAPRSAGLRPPALRGRRLGPRALRPPPSATRTPTCGPGADTRGAGLWALETPGRVPRLPGWGRGRSCACEDPTDTALSSGHDQGPLSPRKPRTLGRSERIGHAVPEYLYVESNQMEADFGQNLSPERRKQYGSAFSWLRSYMEMGYDCPTVPGCTYYGFTL
ncbi:uncharacterized protein [Castor canadensis]|uniref:Uncharacterized protein n=1 Tax=Castor canadensis TaxID=51338 RepID=A0AC58NGZ5_CASCN